MRRGELERTCETGDGKHEDDEENTLHWPGEGGEVKRASVEFFPCCQVEIGVGCDEAEIYIETISWR